MNQTTTWGVKITEELKQRLTKLIEESGLTAKEFVEELVQVYEAQKTKEVVPTISSDLEEVQALTKRLVDIYINMGQKILNLQKAKDEEHNKLIAQKDSLIATLQSKLAELQAENEKLKKEAQNCAKQAAEFEAEINQLKEVNKTNSALIEEYKTKIDTLTALINEYKSFKEQNEVLKAENDTLKVELANKEKTIKDLEERIEFMKKEASIEKETAVLELNKKHQEEFKKLQEEYTAKINFLQEQVNKLLAEKEEYLKKWLKNNN